MKTATYDQKDFIPIAITVLNMCFHGFLCNSFKLIVLQDFPDLKGMISTDELDPYTLELLDHVESDWFKVVGQSTGAINNTLHDLANIYGINIQQTVDDNRIYTLSADFYLEIIVDIFARDGEELTTDDDYQHNFSVYSLSVIVIVNTLCDMIVNRGVIDLSLAWDNNILGYLSRDYETEEHSTALELLQEMGSQLTMGYHKINSLDFNKKHNIT